jgi:dTDP-4-dehydrorhamnose reductase
MTDCLVLGGTGFLGSYFANSPEFESTIQTTKLPEGLRFTGNYLESKFESADDVINILKTGKYKYVINCIANASIENCESNQINAKWLNSIVPGILSEESLKRKFKLIHISTDAVYGLSNIVKNENARVEPISIYGRTKLEGELNVLQANPDSLILRTNFFGHSRKGNSIFDYFYSSLSKNIKSRGFTDIYFTTIYAGQLVKIVSQMKNLSGTFNLAGKERISKYQFGIIIADTLGLNHEIIEPVNIADTDFVNYRAPDLSLDTSKIESYGIVIPSIEHGIRRCVTDIKGLKSDA